MNHATPGCLFIFHTYKLLLTCHKGKDKAGPTPKHKAMKAVAYDDVVTGKWVISFTLWTLYPRVKKEAVAPIPYSMDGPHKPRQNCV
jgi:hypothetical protein